MWHSTARQYLILTSIFGPLQDGRDLVALLGFADAVASGRVNADGVEVGLHAAQVGRGRGRTVGDLEVHAVRLHRNANTQRHNILYYQLCLANLIEVFPVVLPWPAPHWGRCPWSSQSPHQSDSAAVLSGFEPTCMLLFPYLRHKTQISNINRRFSINFFSNIFFWPSPWKILSISFLAQFSAKWSQSQQTGGTWSSVCKNVWLSLLYLCFLNVIKKRVLYTISQEKHYVLGHIGVELPVQHWLQTGPGLRPPELGVLFLNWRWEKWRKNISWTGSISMHFKVSLKRRSKGLTCKYKQLELIAAAWNLCWFTTDELRAHAILSTALGLALLQQVVWKDCITESVWVKSELTSKVWLESMVRK